MFRSFFPNPQTYFVSAVAWTAVAMTLWFTAGSSLEHYLSLGPWLAIQATPDNPQPFFDAGRVIETDGIDGVHLSPDSNVALGAALVPSIRNLVG